MVLGALLSAAVPSAVQFGAQYLGGLQQYKYQRALQEQAAQLNYDYGQKSLLNSPSSTRQGLENAGYNPMLAVQNATSGANSGWTSVGTAKGADYSNIGTDIVSNAQSFQRLENETNVAKAQEDQAYAQADNLKSQSAINSAKLPFVSKREKAEIAQTEANSAKLENDIHYQNEMLNYYRNSLELQEMGLEPQIINAGANAKQAETSRLQYEIDKEVQDIVRDKQKRYKEWGQKHPYLRNIDETVSRYFNGAGINASRSTSIKR